MHWYSGLQSENLEATHALAPEKAILATEACNCDGVVTPDQNLLRWWSRGEALGLDVLHDLRSWTAAWTDWNLV